MSNAAFETVQREALREERRRLARSRRYLQAALGQPSSDWAANVALFQACVNYLDVATKRLVASDISLARQLKKVLPPERKDDIAFTDELDARLTERLEELAGLVAATAKMARSGPEGLEAFRAAVDYFFNAPSTKRSRPSHSMPPLIEAYGNAAFWDNAQADAEACGSEIEAFKVIEQRKWPALDEIVAAMERESKGGG
ncbi:MAG: hypothetical protein JNK21_14460 [Rhodospirillaceae bacterium]|nr:hypothetical protein [Rhodospirillaceae bacterium]